MGRRTRKNSHHLRFKESGSTSRIENPSVSISNLLSDHQLPQELINEILLHIPVKYLLKFKCVSKSWLSLISSPQFIRSHFSKSSSEGDYKNHQLLFSIHDPATAMRQCSVYSALHETESSTHVSHIDYPCQNPDDSLWIVGIVNGLVCLAINATNLVLWNPVLRKFKHLCMWGIGPFTSVNYGFGYDESNDDYKVVSLIRLNTEGVVEDSVKVYSLRADSWRTIEDLNLHASDPGMYSNGKIYWPIRKPGESVVSARNWKIVSLDMVSEKYGEPQQPDYESDDCIWNLGLLGGRLLVLCDYYRKNADLWVMDKYGVEESWCKVASLPYDNVQYAMPYTHHRVIAVLSNGEIVLENGFDLLVYDSNLKEFRNIGLDVGTSLYFQVAPYIESLVSPKGSCL